MSNPYCKLYSEKKASSAQGNLGKFLPEIKHFLDVSNVVNHNVVNKYSSYDFSFPYIFITDNEKVMFWQCFEGHGTNVIFSIDY